MSNNQNKRLPTEVHDPQKTVQLHNNGGLKVGSIIDQSLSLLTPEQQQNLMGKAAEEALRLEIESRERSQNYMYGRKTIEDHVETFNMLDKQNSLTRHVIQSDVKTGAGTMRIESKSGKTCFVATATYGDQNHPNVVLLRTFRDSFLNKTLSGRIFIRFYWFVGPYLALCVQSSDFLKRISKLLLSKLVGYIERNSRILGLPDEEKRR